MQSRIVASLKSAPISKWVVSFDPLSQQNRAIISSWVRPSCYSTSTHQTADPAVHAEDPTGDDADEAAKHEAAKENQQRGPARNGLSDLKVDPNDAIKPGKGSTRLESSGVNQPLDPLKQQKRHYGNSSSSQQMKAEGGKSSPLPPSLDEVTCVGGMDGPPWPDDHEDSVEDNKEYYKHHKPSPLAKVEVSDSRKPVTQATDGGASESMYTREGDVSFSEEQRDTAEEALLRASRIWKESAMRDDPDSPQARALRRAIEEQRGKGSHSVRY
ncbi:hypothetical protein C5167_005034 [Papaver somniferum]|uniref:Uncharacterized protein n=1 Tax=Papaver somniferum TaxID=3469 RepID=A0A4Y7J9B9_PAPSO|nr:uncharacterized protein LOC113273711 [Papaver somniferum]RZC57733.1 hypothetical protein C5167_005034 [Papaver somniferum]